MLSDTNLIILLLVTNLATIGLWWCEILRSVKTDALLQELFHGLHEVACGRATIQPSARNTVIIVRTTQE